MYIYTYIHITCRYAILSKFHMKLQESPSKIHVVDSKCRLEALNDRQFIRITPAGRTMVFEETKPDHLIRKKAVKPSKMFLHIYNSSIPTSTTSSILFIHTSPSTKQPQLQLQVPQLVVRSRISQKKLKTRRYAPTTMSQKT